MQQCKRQWVWSEAAFVAVLVPAMTGCGQPDGHVNANPPFKLVDAEAESGAYPGTLDIPAKDLREKLSPRDTVKLKFDIADGDIERMWVFVDRRTGGDYIGLLASQPHTSGVIYPGMEIRFQARHVFLIGAEQAAADYPDELAQLTETSKAIQRHLESTIARIDRSHDGLEVVATVSAADTFAGTLHNVRETADFEVKSAAGRGDWFVFGTGNADHPDLMFSEGFAIRRSGADVYKYDFRNETPDVSGDQGM